MSYNGWKNYETWAAYSWLSNFEDTYQLCVNLPAHEIKMIVVDIADEACDACEKPGLALDLMRHAVASIDFDELAEAFVVQDADDDADQDEDEDDGYWDDEKENRRWESI